MANLKQFRLTIKATRKILPSLFVSMTVANYLACAVLAASFLYILSPLGLHWVAKVVLSCILVFVSQIIRGVIVFSGQLNPHSRIQKSGGHVAAAVLMGAIAIFEMFHLVYASSFVWFISISVMLGLGVYIEIILVNNFTAFTNDEIVKSKKLKEDLIISKKRLDEIRRFNALLESSKDNEEFDEYSVEDLNIELKKLLNGSLEKV